MQTYPQKPNVTRTSKHEGSYSFEGMPREYKSKEELRKELEARWEAGELDESMKPYLTFLRGGSPPDKRTVEPDFNTEWHEKAKELLDECGVSARQLSKREYKTVSANALRRIRREEYHKISVGYARSIYFYLKRVL